MTNAEVSDIDIQVIFASMDSDESGVVSLKEFCNFAKGSAHSSNYHGELAVFQQRGTTAVGGAEKGAKNALSQALTEAEQSAVQENKKQAAMPSLSDKKARKKEDPALKGLDAQHLILYHIAQHVAYQTDSQHSTGNATGALATHPANVSYVKLFRALDLDLDGQIT